MSNSREEETYSTIFTSLKHPIRRKILRMLYEHSKSFSEMQEIFRIESSHLTYHLENLKELIYKTDDGRYKLSTFGEAAVTTMSKVEEAPKNPSLSIKWKSFFVLLIIGLVVLAGVSYNQNWSLNRLSTEHEQLSLENQQLSAENQRVNESNLFLESQHNETLGDLDYLGQLYNGTLGDLDDLGQLYSGTVGDFNTLGVLHEKILEDFNSLGQLHNYTLEDLSYVWQLYNETMNDLNNLQLLYNETLEALHACWQPEKSDYQIWIGNGPLGSPEDLVLQPYGDPPEDHLVVENVGYSGRWLPFPTEGKGKYIDIEALTIGPEKVEGEYCGTYDVHKQDLIDALIANEVYPINDKDVSRVLITHGPCCHIPSRGTCPSEEADWWNINIQWEVGILEIPNDPNPPFIIPHLLILYGYTNMDAVSEGVYDVTADTWTVTFDNAEFKLYENTAAPAYLDTGSGLNKLWDGQLSFTVEIQRILT